MFKLLKKLSEAFYRLYDTDSYLMFFVLTLAFVFIGIPMVTVQIISDHHEKKITGRYPTHF